MKHTLFFLFLLLGAGFSGDPVVPHASSFSLRNDTPKLYCRVLSHAKGWVEGGDDLSWNPLFVPANRSHVWCSLFRNEDVRAVSARMCMAANRFYWELCTVSGFSSRRRPVVCRSVVDRSQESGLRNASGKSGGCLGGISVLVLALCLVVLLYRRQRTIRRLTEHLTASRQHVAMLQKECQGVQERCRMLMERADRHFEEEARLVRVLELRLRGLQQLSDKAYAQVRPAAFLEAFKRYAKSIRDNESAFADLRYVINRRNARIADRLHANYPRLTEAEIDMLCMLLFGFSFDSIRLLCNHENIDSLYSRRTKIREKLNLPPGYGLEKFLSELAEKPPESPDSAVMQDR